MTGEHFILSLRLSFVSDHPGDVSQQPLITPSPETKVGNTESQSTPQSARLAVKVAETGWVGSYDDKNGLLAKGRERKGDGREGWKASQGKK